MTCDARLDACLDAITHDLLVLAPTNDARRESLVVMGGDMTSWQVV